MAVPPWVATPPSDEVWNDEIRAGWEMAYTSVAGEYEYEIGEIEGTIPADLKGSLWRNGPGNFERGGQRFEHVLDGDGYLGRISIDGSSGRASFKGRFVRTADFEEEEAADAILKRNTFGTQPEGGVLANAGRLALKNVANTNVVTLGGKVLALWEAGMPQRVVPSTMDCEGNDDMGGSLLEGGLVVSTGFEAIDRMLGLGQGFTAHPRIDPASGTLAGFSWASKLDQSACSRRCVSGIRGAAAPPTRPASSWRAASRPTTLRSRRAGTSSRTMPWRSRSCPSSPASRDRSSA